MPHSITCGACKASFSIPDDVWEKRVQGQVATLKCRQCKLPIEVDGRTRKGPPAAPREQASRTETSAATSHAAAPSPTASPAVAPAVATAAKSDVAASKARLDRPKPVADVKLAGRAVDAPTPAAKSAPRQPEPSPARQGSSGTTQPEPSATARKATGEQARSSLLTPASTAGVTSGIGRASVLGASPQKSTFASQPRKAPETASTGFTSSSSAKFSEVVSARPKATAPVATKFSVREPKAGAISRAEMKSSPQVAKDESDTKELWVVSYGVDDDRELTTTQVRDLIAQGRIDSDTIVWQEGMSDWLPISKVAELARSLKPKGPLEVAVAPLTSKGESIDEGDDETVIYKPGSQLNASLLAAREEALSARPMPSAERTRLNATRPETAAAREKRPVSPAIEGDDRAESEPLPQARSNLNAPRRAEAPTQRGGFSPVEAGSPKAPPTAAKAGGPPPLRRTQPSRPDDTSRATPPATQDLVRENEGVVTSVREYAPAARAAAPPPLPEKREVPEAKPAMFPPAVQPEERLGAAAPSADVFPPVVQAMPGFAPVAVPSSHSLRPTSSFAPRPSDIAALTKIRPKFPKWLPFAVLAGLVLVVAVLAALSWFRGDNAESARGSAAPEVSGPIGVPGGPPKTASKTQTPAQQETRPKTTTPSADFASRFAQAAAKQRPTARFDRQAAEKALAPAFTKAGGCHNKGEPTGNASVTISLSPSGQVLSVTLAPPFTTTFTAECIRNALRDASVPPFQGAPGRLVHSISIRWRYTYDQFCERPS